MIQTLVFDVARGILKNFKQILAFVTQRVPSKYISQFGPAVWPDEENIYISIDTVFRPIRTHQYGSIHQI